MEQRVAKALGITSNGHKIQRCIMRVCSEIDENTPDDEIVLTANRMPYMLKRQLYKNDSESDSDSDSSSESSESDKSSLEGGSKDSNWEIQKSISSKSKLLKQQLYSFYQHLLKSKLNKELMEIEEKLKKYPSKHTNRAIDAIREEKTLLEDRLSNGWKEFYDEGLQEMSKVHPTGNEWRATLYKVLREIRKLYIAKMFSKVNSAHWNTELRAKGERAMQLLNIMNSL